MLQRPNRRSQAAERFSLPGEPTDGDEDQIEPEFPLGMPVAADQAVVRGMVYRPTPCWTVLSGA